MSILQSLTFLLKLIYMATQALKALLHSVAPDLDNQSADTENSINSWLGIEWV